jgi:hypothetical protein
MTELRPEHTSRLQFRPDPRPKDMESMKMDPEVRQGIEKIALHIFTDMTNSGASLQQTLTAIYLSGVQNTIAAIKDEQDKAFKEIRRRK